jgi:surface protein
MTHKMILNKFICPMSGCIFNEPFLASDGYTYEKQCIEEWLKNNTTSPMTKEDMTLLRFNRSLKYDIDIYLDSNDSYKKYIYQLVTNFNNTLNDDNIRNEVACWILTGASRFGHISNWNVSNVTRMTGLFYCATKFNQPLNDWDVSNVTDMNGMFQGATNFNHPLSNWNVSNVTDMSGMFFGATNFNQPLNNWNVSNVTTQT